MCRICIVQIQPRKHILDRAEYTAPTRKHEQDHTGQEYICPETSRSCCGNRLSVRRVEHLPYTLFWNPCLTPPFTFGRFVLMRDDGVAGHLLETAAAVGDPALTTTSPKTTTASFKGRGKGCMVAGLSPNTLYHFRVCAVNNRTRSMLSTPLEVRECCLRVKPFFLPKISISTSHVISALSFHSRGTQNLRSQTAVRQRKPEQSQMNRGVYANEIPTYRVRERNQTSQSTTKYIQKEC